MTLTEIYKGAENLINQLIRKESTAQGPSCNMCYARVLNNYKGLQDAFVKLEKEANLLNEV